MMRLLVLSTLWLVALATEDETLFNSTLLGLEEFKISECSVRSTLAGCPSTKTALHICIVDDYCIGDLSGRSLSVQYSGSTYSETQRSCVDDGTYSLAVNTASSSSTTTYTTIDYRDFCGVYVFADETLIASDTSNFGGNLAFEVNPGPRTTLALSLTVTGAETVTTTTGVFAGTQEWSYPPHESAYTSFADVEFSDTYEKSVVYTFFSQGKQNTDFGSPVGATLKLAYGSTTVYETTDLTNNFAIMVSNIGGTFNVVPCTQVTMAISATTGGTSGFASVNRYEPMNSNSYVSIDTSTSTTSVDTNMCYDERALMEYRVTSQVSGAYGFTFQQYNDGALKQSKEFSIAEDGTFTGTYENAVYVNLERNNNTVADEFSQCFDIIFILLPDDYPEELEWSFLVDGIEFDSGSVNGTVTRLWEFCQDTEYSVVLTDSFGDGFCCDYSQGDLVLVPKAGLSNELLSFQLSQWNYDDNNGGEIINYHKWDSSVTVKFVVDETGTFTVTSASQTSLSDAIFGTSSSFDLESAQYLAAPALAFVIVAIGIVSPILALRKAKKMTEKQIADEARENEGRDNLRKKTNCLVRAKDTCCVQFMYLALRVTDWISDILVMYAIVSVLYSAPSYQFSVPKVTTGDGDTLSIEYSELIGSTTRDCTGSIPMDYATLCVDGSFEVEYTATDYWFTTDIICYAEDYSGGQENCEGGGSCTTEEKFYNCYDTANNYMSYTYSESDYEAWVALTSSSLYCEYEDDMSSKNFDFSMIADCSEYSFDGVTQFLVRDTVWECTSVGENTYFCALRDYVVINIFMLLLFVLLAKELFVITHSDFCVRRLITNDLNKISGDSVLLLVAFFKRIIFPKSASKLATVKITDNEFFFFSWMFFDFVEKIASMALTAAILLINGTETDFSTASELALFAFITSFVGVILGAKLWRGKLFDLVETVKKDKLTIYNLKTGKKVGVVDKEAPAADKNLIGIYQVPKDALKRYKGSCCYFNPHKIGFVSYITFRILVTLLVTLVTIRLSYTDYGSNRTNINFQLKGFYLIYLVCWLGEMSIVYDRFVFAKRSVTKSVYSTFMVRWGVFAWAMMGRKNYMLIKVVKKNIPQKIHLAINFLPRYSFLKDILIYGLEILGLGLMLNLLNDFENEYNIALTTPLEADASITDATESV